MPQEKKPPITSREAKESPPARKRARKKSTPIISIDLYNQMFAAYIERQSAAHVAKTCGVTERTATAYIKKGHPKRGLASLEARLAKINDMTRQQVDYDLARARSEVQQAARATFAKLAKAIVKLEPEAFTADKVPEHLNRLLTVLERTFGEAEHSHEVRGKFSSWSMADLKAYLERNIIPDLK